MKKIGSYSYPDNWELHPLPDVLFLQEGPGIRKKEYQDHGYPMINVRCVQDGYIDMSKARAANMELATTKWAHFQIDENDILFTISGTIGRAAIVKKSDLPLLMNTSVVRFKPIHPALDLNFVYHYLRSDFFVEMLKDMSTGTAIQNVGPSHLKKLHVPVPPLPEQQRIVSILDEAFATIAKAKNNAEQNLKNAKELFESYLQGVFENGNWETKSLKELTTKIGSGATPRGGQENYKAEGISLVRSMNVHDWEFRERNLAFIDEQQAKELDGVSLQENDVLLNITGASVARCCVFPKEYLPARVNQHVSIIRPKKELLDATFLNLLLTSKPYKDQLLFTGEQGATRQAITKAQIESFRISIPPLKEQHTIVRQLDTLRAETKRLEAIYQQKLLNLEELKKSVLQKAFRGELN